MDLVLIPKLSDAAQNHHFFSERGLSQLARLGSWLAEQGSPSTQYIVVPRGQPDLVPLLAEFALVLRATGTFAFVFAAEDVSCEHLERAAMSGVRDFVIHADATGSFDVLAQAALEQFMRGPFAERGSIQVWMPGPHDGRGFERTLGFAACGVAMDAIREPRFPLEPSPGLELPAKPPPRELLEGAPGCQYFSGSLTIDASAGIQACARHAPDERLGSFLDESPEALIYRKGYSIRRLQGTATCRSCFYSGRFSWPKPTVQTIETLLQTGMDAGPESAEES